MTVSRDPRAASAGPPAASENDGASPRERRTYQEIGDNLITRIRSGEFESTGRLPPERELAQGYEVGRNTIRDALVMLEVKGLVEPRQGSGIYITRLAYQTSWSATRRFPRQEAIDDYPPAGPFELLQARQWLESHMARLAAMNATDDDLSAIEEAFENHKRASYGEPKENFDILFHLSIAQATQNAELVRLVHQLWHRRDDNPLWRNLHQRITDPDYRDRWVNDHENLLRAMRRRDADAAYVAMWNHIENVKRFLTESNTFEVSEPGSL